MEDLFSSFMFMLVKRYGKVAVKSLSGHKGHSKKNQFPTVNPKFEQDRTRTFISKGVSSHARVQGSELIQT